MVDRLRLLPSFGEAAMVWGVLGRLGGLRWRGNVYNHGEPVGLVGCSKHSLPMRIGHKGIVVRLAVVEANDRDRIWNFCISRRNRSMGFAHLSYGQHLRKQVLAKTYFVEWSPGELVPGESDSVVFSGEGIGGLYGERLTAAGRAKKWIFVNPNPPPQTLAEALDSSPPIRILWGEFHSGRARYQWDAIALEFEQIYLEEITTAGKYIPDWD